MSGEIEYRFPSHLIGPENEGPAFDAFRAATRGPNEAMVALMKGSDDAIVGGFRREFQPHEAEILIRLYQDGFPEDRCERVLEILNDVGIDLSLRLRGAKP